MIKDVYDKTFAELRDEAMENIGKGRIVVLAPCQGEADSWRRRSGLSAARGDVLYASSSRVVEGTRPCAVVVLSGFWGRRDAVEIRDVIERICVGLAQEVLWFHNERIGP